MKRTELHIVKYMIAQVVKHRLLRVLICSLLLGALLQVLPTILPHSFAHFLQLPVAAASNPIQTENGNPGTPGWDDFSSVAQQDAISGFGSKISVNHGDSIDFYVTTTASSFTIDIFRTGWYQGIGARQLVSLGSFPGVHQPIPAPDPVTGMVSCANWTKTTTLNVPA